MSKTSTIDQAIEAVEDVRDPATDAEEVVRRHGHLLQQMANRDDEYGAIARATLKAGGDR